MNKAVNERFINCVNDIISVGNTSKTDIANNISIGRTKLSEILNKRMNIDLDTVIKFCEVYYYNPVWMVFGENNNIEVTNADYKELAEARAEIIEYKNKEITDLKKEIDQLKKAQQNPKGYGMVAESKSKLKK